jgi:hypothetical protein
MLADAYVIAASDVFGGAAPQIRLRRDFHKKRRNQMPPVSFYTDWVVAGDEWRVC